MSQVQSFIPTQLPLGKESIAQKWQFLYYKIQRFFLLLQIQHNSSAILQRNLKRICAFSRQAAASSVKGLSKEFYFTLATGLLKLDLKCASSQARHAYFIGLQITTSPHIWGEYWRQVLPSTCGQITHGNRKLAVDNLFVSMTFRKGQLFVITDHETLTFPQKLRGGLSWDRSYLLPLIQLTRTLELVYIHRLWEPVQSDTIRKRPIIWVIWSSFHPIRVLCDIEWPWNEMKHLIPQSISGCHYSCSTRKESEDLVPQ